MHRTVTVSEPTIAQTISSESLIECSNSLLPTIAITMNNSDVAYRYPFKKIFSDLITCKVIWYKSKLHEYKLSIIQIQSYMVQITSKSACCVCSGAYSKFSTII